MNSWRKFYWPLLKCGPRLIAATVTANSEALENTSEEIERIHREHGGRRA